MIREGKSESEMCLWGEQMYGRVGGLVLIFGAFFAVARGHSRE